MKLFGDCATVELLRMNCQHFEFRIQELLDEHRRLRDDEQLAVHSARCSACQRKLCDFELLESYFDPTLTVNARLPIAPMRFSDNRQRHWLFVAIAATLLAMVIPLLHPLRPDSTTQLANATHSLNVHDNSSTLSSEPPLEVSWPEMLATIEALPQRLEALGPVYSCTAQMTGISSLTSSWNLTVDLLRSQLNGHVEPKDGAECTPGNRFELGDCVRLV